ncbi:ABC transporter related protein [Desulfurococcus mucosus DSM 2162]|uniref:ABC transporter related protein n=1 Tax=Desulfurococcus mucosus (strain ATCC 35584 / DSM 2162 / JCM 9187 / O7/1) TaxID=765177 RepID=E8RAS1_DESM0|nr:ABC transporter related protein [Desulfurococcus mucosus DSM 2162]
MTKALEVSDLWVEYRGLHDKPVQALRGVSLSIEKREVVAVMGPNGSGKSTLLRSVIGLEKPSKGFVRLLGTEPQDALGKIAYLPEADCLAPYMTGLENAVFLAGLTGLGRGYLDKAVSVAEELGLSRLDLKRLVKKYSMGMKRLLAISLLLAMDRELYIMDEPTAGLDPVKRPSVLEAFHAAKSNGATVVFTTHIGVDAEKADKVVFMHSGRVVDYARPVELVEKYAGRLGVLVARGLGARRAVGELKLHGFTAEEVAEGVRVVAPLDKLGDAEELLKRLMPEATLVREPPSLEDAFRAAVVVEGGEGR